MEYNFELIDKTIGSQALAEIFGSTESEIVYRSENDDPPLSDDEVDRVWGFCIENEWSSKQYALFPTIGAVINLLGLIQSDIATVLGVSRQTISNRLAKRSPVSIHELLTIYRYSERKCAPRYQELLAPMMKKYVPELFLPDLKLALIIGEKWQALEVYINTEDDVDDFHKLLQFDVRPIDETYVKPREISIHYPDCRPRLRELIIEKFDPPPNDPPSRLTYTLTVSTVERDFDCPFLIAIASGEENKALHPAESGFTPVLGATLRAYLRLSVELKRKRKKVYGPKMVGSVPSRPRPYPGADDGDSKMLEFTGQIGGRYMLKLIAKEGIRSDGSRENWLVILTAVNGRQITERRCIQIFTQSGRVILECFSDNLPAQDLWPEHSQPPGIHIDELFMAEFVKPKLS